jgi:two-component system sensor histidine kinase MprB
MELSAEIRVLRVWRACHGQLRPSSFPPPAGDVDPGERSAIARAIWNLVENAAKWSNGAGGVDLTVAGGEVIVRDHGPGVPAADRPFIFDRFYRSEAARGRPGSGLGLAIVRQIAENHGGRVDVEEAEGGGARFRLVLVAS